MVQQPRAASGRSNKENVRAVPTAPLPPSSNIPSSTDATTTVQKKAANHSASTTVDPAVVDTTAGSKCAVDVTPTKQQQNATTTNDTSRPAITEEISSVQQIAATTASTAATGSTVSTSIITTFVAGGDSDKIKKGAVEGDKVKEDIRIDRVMPSATENVKVGEGGTTTIPPATDTSNSTKPDVAASSIGKEKMPVRGIPQTEWLRHDHDKAMGATILEKTKGIACFRIWGPHIEECWTLVGKEGEEQRILMTSEGDGLFACQVEGVSAGLPYHFVLTSRWNDCYASEGHELHRRDPYARQTDFNSNTCYVVDPAAFKWQPFEAPPFNKFIIYEMHIGTFARKEGISQFAAITERLRYIKDLGYNAIELLPVPEFGGKWGYNPRLLMAPHGTYGTPEELRTLVNTAHSRGLAVIFDIVLNHGSVHMNSLWNYDGYGPHNNGGVYFEGEKDSGWGSRFAFHKKEVREMLKAAALIFAIEYNADGLRLDAVHHMPWHFLKELTSTLKSRAPKCCLIAEITPENPAVCNDAGFDSCWAHASYYDAVKVMRGVECEQHMNMLKAIVNGHRGFRKSYQSINSVLGSHDQCGNRDPHGHSSDDRVGRYFIDQVGGRDNWHGRATTRMWIALQGLARPLPMTFMGTETAQGGWWHVDRNFDWKLVEGGDVYTQQMMHLTKMVNKIRMGSDYFTDDKEVEWCHEDGHNRVLGFHRVDNLVVVNVGESQWERCEYGVRTHWKQGASLNQILNTQAEEFGGWEGSWTAEKEEESGDRKVQTVGENGMLFVNLPKWSVVVFRLRK